MIFDFAKTHTNHPATPAYDLTQRIVSPQELPSLAGIYSLKSSESMVSIRLCVDLKIFVCLRSKLLILAEVHSQLYR